MKNFEDERSPSWRFANRLKVGGVTMTAELQQRDVSEINTYNIQTCFWMGGAGSHPGLPGTRGRLLPVTLEASRVIPKSDKKLPWHNVMYLATTEHLCQ